MEQDLLYNNSESGLSRFTAILVADEDDETTFSSSFISKVCSFVLNIILSIEDVVELSEHIRFDSVDVFDKCSFKICSIINFV